MSDAINAEDGSIENIGAFRQLILRGTDYREEYEFEMFGEAVTIKLAPLSDEQYSLLLEQMEEDVDDEKFQRLMQEADGKEGEELEEEFDVGFIEAMRTAAKLGIDPESVGETQEGVAELVDMMVGGQSLMIGQEVMEITSNVSAAKEFPGARAGE